MAETGSVQNAVGNNIYPDLVLTASLNYSMSVVVLSQTPTCYDGQTLKITTWLSM